MVVVCLGVDVYSPGLETYGLVVGLSLQTFRFRFQCGAGQI